MSNTIVSSNNEYHLSSLAQEGAVCVKERAREIINTPPHTYTHIYTHIYLLAPRPSLLIITIILLSITITCNY